MLTIKQATLKPQNEDVSQGQQSCKCQYTKMAVARRVAISYILTQLFGCPNEEHWKATTEGESDD